jgi:integrase
MRKRIREPKIYKSGGLYCFRITDNFGKRKEIKALTGREAKLKRGEMLKQLFSDLSGGCVYRVTFEQGIKFWRDHKENTVVVNSLGRYETIIKNFNAFLSKVYPDLKYFDETLKDDNFALNYRNYRLKLGRANKTVTDEEILLSSVYEALIKKNKIPHKNPFSELEPLAVEPVQNRRVIPDSELIKFFEVVKSMSQGIYWYGLFMTLYFTGMRRDEVRLMKKMSVNFDSGYFELPKSKTKKGKMISKTVPIHPKLIPMLEEAIARSKSEYVFPDEDGEVMPKNKIRDVMMKICEISGIPKATPHDFRHTWTTKARLAGMSNEARREVGGWSSNNVMEKTYTHYPDERIKSEYFAVDFLECLVKSKP